MITFLQIVKLLNGDSTHKLNLRYSDFKAFYSTDLFLYPVKTSRNPRFSDVFREYSQKPVT